ncbi:hypothetical protein [Thiomonas sp.]
MKLFAMCMVCQAELGHPSFEPFFAPYYEDMIAPIQCARGHKTVVMLQSQKFEVLLESGAAALAAGFTLEAAATFSAAFERFIEFAAKVMLLHMGMDSATYDEMFKELARQSERQIGSFMALHALVLGVAYKPVPKIAQFRNDTIHKGAIPTPDEVTNFCSLIYTEIVRTAKLLRARCEKSINAVIMDNLQARRKKVPAGIHVATVAMSGLSSLMNLDAEEDFEQAYVAFLEGQRVMTNAVPELQALHALLFPKKSNAQ